MTRRDDLRAVWERDERYEQLVELAPDGILIHDGTQIVLANAAAVRLAGAVRRSQLVGLPIEKFLDPPYLKAVQTHLTDSQNISELAPPVRDRFHRLDGSDRDVEVRAVAFMDHGQPSAHLIIRDITERLAAERSAVLTLERLQQAQKFESVGALAGGIAHEVSNMMQVVLGFADFLLADTEIPEARLADIREITRAAERAAAVTRQLLAFSRRAVHQPQVVDLANEMFETEPFVRRLLGDNRRLYIASRAKPQVWMDPGQLQQIVINLALNARDAMPESGTLTIATSDLVIVNDLRTVEGTTIPAGHYATLKVCDSGSGMAPDVLDRIFEPFFTTKPLGHGTGLGLSAVHGMLTQNGGYIGVESAPGMGTTFTLYLPVLSFAEPAQSREWPPLVAQAAQTGSTILVVDDEPAVRAITARILERSGFNVVQASGGLEALELMERLGMPDLVLTDLMMPVMGGVALRRKLREDNPEVPVVFMSGYSAEELHRQDLPSSDGELLQKPFSHTALLAFVTSALAWKNARLPTMK